MNFRMPNMTTKQRLNYLQERALQFHEQADQFEDNNEWVKADSMRQAAESYERELSRELAKLRG